MIENSTVTHYELTDGDERREVDLLKDERWMVEGGRWKMEGWGCKKYE